MRESRFCLRSVLRPFLCSLIAFSIILLNTSIESNASSYTTSSYSYTSRYNYAESSIYRSNCYLPSDYEGDYESGTGWSEDVDFWYLGTQQPIFTTSADFYGYRVVMNRNSMTTINMDSCKYSRWLFGTQEQLYNGSFPSNYEGVNSSANAFWIETNNSVVQLKVAPLFKFTDVGSYNINCEFKYTVTAYRTKDAYNSALSGIQSELENQTSEMETQTEELQNQTEEMKEQTNTQKGMLSKMTDFFGSFFDNLIDSVIGLFVPSSDELASIFQRFDDFFSEKFGFLYYPIDVLTDFVALMTTETSEASITLPGFSIMGYEVWAPQTYNFGRVTLIQEISGYVQTGTGVIIVLAFLNYVDKKFNLITRG